MRDWLAFLCVCGLVALLVPFPSLLPLSLVGLALIWFVTPVSRASKREDAKATRGQGS